MIAKIFFGSIEEEREELIDIKNPYNSKVVSKYPICGENDALKALNIAKVAKKKAKDSPLSQRIKWLEDVASKLQIQKEDIAKTITDEVGKPISFARIEVQRCIETIKLTASAILNNQGELFSSDATLSGKKSLSYYKREPVGVVVAITPFNFPLNLVAHKLAPALICGNSVVLKPTPEAPLTAYKFVKLFIQSHYAIPDVLSLIYGDAEVGNALVSSRIPRVISFTGSVQVGEIITRTAGIKKLALELGGNAATYIQSSANLKEASRKCAIGAFINSGQVCISLQRIYVDESIAEVFAQFLAKESRKLKVGSPYEEDTFLGPLIDENSALRAKNWVKNALNEGAVLLCGGEKDGKIFTPTVMSKVKDDMNIVCEEVFAPIVSVIAVKNFDEAVKKNE